MTFTRRLKRFVDNLFPRMTAVRRARRSRRGSHRDAIAKGYAALDRRLVEIIGLTVQSGPFAGMHMSPLTLREHAGPELLGVYEAELHPHLERLLARTYPQVIDVGAKYGYYAVGLARRLPGAESVAFDIDPWARRATREMARANGVSATLRVLGFATPAWFDRHLQPGALVVSDCEGFEGVLFPAIRTPALDTCTLVIEVHEAMAAGVTERLLARLSATHAITRVPTRGPMRVPEAVRARLASHFSDAELVVLTDELRGSQQEWMVAEPLGRATG